jgi:hypothetical protein
MNSKVCKYFMTEGCNKVNCKFIHNINYCKHYYKGNCKYGNKCKKSHNFNPLNKEKINYRKKKNTESFEPDHSDPDMRILVNTNIIKKDFKMTKNDVMILPNFFEEEDNRNIYDSLLKEMKETGYKQDELWKLWHGDSHTIADDKLGDWKSRCPTFNIIINKIASYLNVDIKATRFNWYKNNKDWKPYHRDAAAIDERKAKTQNITIGITFGATRTASFKHMKTKTRIDFPLTNGSIYIFNKQVNIDWMHGITQELELNEEGRISIIIWGYSNKIL